MKTWIWFLLLGVIALASTILWLVNPTTGSDTAAITSFEECVAAGNPVAESFPPTCRANGEIFTQNVGNAVQLSDMIVVEVPQANANVASPLFIEGRARGTWFFEGEFPIEIVDSEGTVLARANGMATDDWMTEDFVDFAATLRFVAPEGRTGKIFFTQADARGEGGVPVLEVPVKF